VSSPSYPLAFVSDMHHVSPKTFLKSVLNFLFSFIPYCLKYSIKIGFILHHRFILHHMFSDANVTMDLIRCDSGNQVDIKYACILEYDSRDDIMGCRDATHLQNCGEGFV